MQNALSDYGDSTRLSSIHQIEQVIAKMNVYAQHKKSMEEKLEIELNKKTKVMNNTAQFRYKFLENRDETGRFYVYSFRTGKTYFIEPIGPDRPADWGSYNPSTGKIENKKGFDKFTGAISESESLITKENGFENIKYSGIGASPFSVIDKMDAKHPTIN